MFCYAALSIQFTKSGWETVCSDGSVPIIGPNERTGFLLLLKANAAAHVSDMNDWDRNEAHHMFYFQPQGIVCYPWVEKDAVYWPLLSQSSRFSLLMKLTVSKNGKASYL